MVFTRASRAEISGNDRHWAWKFALRLILVAFCLIAIGCVSWVATVSRETAFWPSFSVITLIIPLIFSIVWAAILITLLSIRKRPAHPAFSVGVDLVLWLALIVTGLFFTALAARNLETPFVDDGYGYGYYGGYRRHREHHQHHGTDEKQFGAVGLVGAIFMDLSIILHFVLFVWACVDTHRYNQANSVERLAEARANLMVAEMRQRGEIMPAPVRNTVPNVAEYV